ncbi:MAG: hypothetical protein K2P17_03255 [Helicobacteraceae bacterium]|nr:hypothetical protein [Helicobacteraceae bacterium]
MEKFTFNNPASSLIDLYKYSFIDRIFIKLQTRALGSKIEKLFIILPALINMNNTSQQNSLDKAKEYLLNSIKPQNLALKVYDRVILRLLEYKKDNNLYIQDRQRAFDIIAQNIQLYNLIDKILDKEMQEQKDTIKEIVRKQYDENYKLDDKDVNILNFQEQNYL